MALRLDEVFKGAERLTCVNRVTALGGVVAITTGCPVVNFENLLRCNNHFFSNQGFYPYLHLYNTTAGGTFARFTRKNENNLLYFDGVMIIGVVNSISCTGTTTSFSAACLY